MIQGWLSYRTLPWLENQPGPNQPGRVWPPTRKNLPNYAKGTKTSNVGLEKPSKNSMFIGGLEKNIQKTLKNIRKNPPKTSKKKPSKTRKNPPKHPKTIENPSKNIQKPSKNHPKPAILELQTALPGRGSLEAAASVGGSWTRSARPIPQ